MPNIQIECPHCLKANEVAAGWGQTAKCDSCGGVFAIPSVPVGRVIQSNVPPITPKPSPTVGPTLDELDDDDDLVAADAMAQREQWERERTTQQQVAQYGRSQMPLRSPTGNESQCTKERQQAEQDATTSLAMGLLCVLFGWSVLLPIFSLAAASTASGSAAKAGIPTPARSTVGLLLTIFVGGGEAAMMILSFFR